MESSAHDRDDLALARQLVEDAASALRHEAGAGLARWEELVRAFLQRAYDAELSPEAVTDLFCVSEYSVVDSVGLDKGQQAKLVELFDRLNTLEVRRRVAARKH